MLMERERKRLYKRNRLSKLAHTTHPHYTENQPTQSLSLSLSPFMAPSTKYLSFFFSLTLLLSLHVHVHARESQFFSKVSSNTINNNNNVNEPETVLPNKEEPLNKQEQDPTFIPNTQNGYGLYGHETGQLPPSTTTTTTNVAPYTATNNNHEAYVTNPQPVTDTRFTEASYTTPVSSNNNNNNYYTGGSNNFNGRSYTTPTSANNNNYYNGGNTYETRATETKFVDRGYTTTPTNANNNYNNYYNGGNGYNNNQRQGMSDTRYLENGKYYYDLSSENYNTRTTDSRNGYNTRGYYGNNENTYEYNNNNSMEGYQNQEEYQQSQDEFEP